MDAEKTEIKRDERGRFVQGNPPGPGRPEGSVSIIGEIKKVFRENPERFHEYVEEVIADKMLRRELIQQIDGKPVQPIAGVEGQPLQIQVIAYGDNNSSQLQT